MTINWNETYYIDCLDKNRGLPYLLDLIKKEEIKKIDLGIADPPFNVSFKGTNKNDKECYYNDNLSQIEYKKWTIEWFSLIKKICKGLVIFVGNTNQDMWSEIEKPLDRAIHFQPNRQGRSTIAYLTKYEPIFFYGKFNGKLGTNVIIENLKMGNNRELKGGIHPCPGCSKVYREVLFRLKPTNVLDPFIGSGTTAQECIKLGIPWIGYEINKTYKHDIDLRIKNCKKELIQSKLF